MINSSFSSIPVLSSTASDWVQLVPGSRVVYRVMADLPHDETDAVSRKARKRELDRRAQCAARERTRNRIADLEATIEAMKAEESGVRAAQLMEELTRARQERDELANTLRLIRELTERRIGPLDINSSGTSPQLRSDSTQSPYQPVTADGTAAEAISTTLSIDLASASINTSDIEHPSSFFTSHATEQPDSQAAPILHTDWSDGLPMDLTLMCASPETDELILPEPLTICDCLYLPAPPGTLETRNRAETSIWRTANRILTIEEPFTENMLRLEDDTCEDLPIRAILQGWDSLDTRKLPLLWQKLHQIDLLQFRDCNNVERLAIFIIMHRMLRQRADASVKSWSKNIPLWLTDRFAIPP